MSADRLSHHLRIVKRNERTAHIMSLIERCNSLKHCIEYVIISTDQRFISSIMLTDYRVRQREYLLEISRAMTARLDLEAVLRRILDAACELLASNVGLIVLRREDGSFGPRAIYGILPAMLPFFAPLWADAPERDRSGR